MVRKGKVVTTFAEGLADIETKTAMTADTPTLVASISKTLLGTAIGKLNITVNNPLPALPFLLQRPDGQSLNPSWLQLAQHQSGIIDQDSTLFCTIYGTDDGVSLLDQLRGTDPGAAPRNLHINVSWPVICKQVALGINRRISLPPVWRATVTLALNWPVWRWNN